MNESAEELVQLNELERLKLSAEQKTNFIRITAIALFYLIHLWHVASPKLGDSTAGLFGFDIERQVSSNSHIAISLLCFGWLMQAFGIHFIAFQKPVPDRLVTLLTLADLVWLTAILCVSTGPAGPMVIGYFLIIVISGIRFDLSLVRWSTAGAVVGYLIVLGSAKWPLGWLKEFEIHTVPRYHQIMIIVALIFCGVVVGQIVRHAYVMSSALKQPE